MKRATFALMVALFGLAAIPARADLMFADPNGFDEVPTLSSPARADFRARLNKEETEIAFSLKYAGFTTPVAQAHIHFGRTAINGGIMVFLCSNLGNGPAGTPACPATEGTVTGTLTAAGMVGGAAGQGIAAGEFAEMVDAIRAGATYVNIHTQQFPGGEIRDQVKALGFPH
jgi:CHRD domain